MAIELCEFLSDIKHPENIEKLGETTALLLSERRHAGMERHRRDFEEQRRHDNRDYDEVDGQSQHEGS